MSRVDRIALFLCFASLLVNALLAARVFENIPHLEDEMTLVWQAQTISRGQAVVPSPPASSAFLVPFVIDDQGFRFGKYPLGFPVLLSFGMRLGVRDWVNPAIAACALWLIYRLAKKLLDEPTALLALILTATSPYYLIQSANLLTHAWSLFLSSALALAWLDTFHPPSGASNVPAWLTVAVAGLALGTLALTRPYTALGVALPFGLHGVLLLKNGPAAIRRGVLAIGLLAGGVATLHLLWQATLTGSLWINPYTLWWPSDVIGFGPGTGFRPGGHTLPAGLSDALYGMLIANHDLFGWPWLSFLFLPFGLLAGRRNPRALMVSAVFPALVLLYLLYWVGAWVYGPRYYYEGLYSLTLLSAAGIAWVYRRLPLPRWRALVCRHPSPKALASFAFTCGLALLFSANLLIYTPLRLGSLKGLYGSSASVLADFKQAAAQVPTPALVIVHIGEDWHAYAPLLELSNPFLDSPYIFALSQGSQADAALPGQFPGRAVFHHFPGLPNPAAPQP